MKGREVKIKGQDQNAQLAQEFHVMHTPNEFLLSILEIIPQMHYQIPDEVPEDKKIRNVAKLQNTGIVQQIVGRFVMSPAAMKKLVHVLTRNLEQYEKKFGEIAINPPEGLQ